MNILITGIHGFVGSNLVMALKSRHTLYGLDIVATEKDGVIKTFSWEDIKPESFSFQNFSKLDVIIHLAGKAHDTKNQSAAQSYFDINTGLTQKIFDFFLQSSAKKFIFFSSVKAAADSVVGDILTEDVIPAPIGPYGESKIKAEEYIINKLTVDGEQLTVDNGQLTVDSYENINYVDKVSCKEIIVYANGESRSFSIDLPIAQLNCQLSTVNCQLKRVVLVDCGVKTNIIRCLLRRNVEVIRVPWDYDFNGLQFDGLFISNGPGDPDTCDAAVQNIRKAMQNPQLPIFGICMGNQLLSKAGGAKIYKLKYGHRSHNQPVRMVGTERCFITSQNHGYAVDNNTLGAEWEPLFINMNDGSNEGIRHKTNPWFSAQFHPEAASGPTDTEFLFDEFVKLL